MKRILKIT